MDKNCITCGKSFHVDRSIEHRKKNCSRVCSAIWRVGKSWNTPEASEKIRQSKLGEKNPNWSGGRPNCLLCNGEVRNHKAKYCWDCIKNTDIMRQLVKSGSEHYRHAGIKSTEPRFRSSGEYKRWRRAVVERDGLSCVLCGSGNDIEVDHIKPFALFPSLRVDILNGRVLCRKCHQLTATYGGATRSYAR